MEKKNVGFKNIVLFFMICTSNMLMSQDLEQLGKSKLLRLTGGVSANTIFYEGQSNREQLTYFARGNLNLNISGVYNIPFSFSYSNQKFQSSNPFKFNRLSLHPTYKWVTAHIGDVSMSFSPYTLNGHQFTGLGLDISLGEKLKAQAMYGRLLKAAEYNEEDSESNPAFRRLGYGTKLQYDFDKFSLGAIVFAAKDDPASISSDIPIELEVSPKENVVTSAEVTVKLFNKGSLRLESAISTITEDISVVSNENDVSSFFSTLINTNVSTRQFRAHKLQFDYQIKDGTVGFGYEYIDPEYRTLGAYYFNNDLENFKISATRSLFNGMVWVAFDGGIQRDDLDNTKSSQLQRTVSAIDLKITPSEKIQINTGYSNFQSFTNTKDQFDLINEIEPTINLDTLDYRQISQNTFLNANFVLRNSENIQDNIQTSFTYQTNNNEQNDKAIENGKSDFYSFSGNYSITYPAINFTLSPSINASLNVIGDDTSFIYGPSIGASKLFFDKRLRTNGSVNYNANTNNGEKNGEVVNFRLGGNYVIKERHHLNLNLLFQYRNSTSNEGSDFTATLGYNYRFGKLPKPRFNLKKRNRGKKDKEEELIVNRAKKSKEETLRFVYRDSLYQGTMREINSKIGELKNSPKFRNTPSYKKNELTRLMFKLFKERKTNLYKFNAIAYLDELYKFVDFLELYDQFVYEGILQLQKDMNKLNISIEKDFVTAKIALDNHPLHKADPKTIETASETMKAELKEYQKAVDDGIGRLVAHQWMQPIILSYDSLEKVEDPEDNYLGVFKDKEIAKVFELFEKNKKEEIAPYIMIRIIEFYFKESLQHTDPNKFYLKYIEKI